MQAGCIKPLIASLTGGKLSAVAQVRVCAMRNVHVCTSHRLAHQRRTECRHAGARER